MRAPVRLLLSAAIPFAALCVSILVFADESGFRGTAVGVWLREARRGEHLRKLRSDLERSNESIHISLIALMEGRITLPEAAERVRSERENWPSPLRLKPTLQPGESLEDYYLRFTVELVQRHLQEEARQTEVVQRLQRELQYHLRKQPAYAPAEGDASNAAIE